MVFLVVVILGAFLLYQISIWYKKQVSHRELKVKEESKKVDRKSKVSKKAIIAITLLVFLVFARSLYVAGINNYYQFYLFEDYGISIKSAQKYIFIFLFASVLGTFTGGPLSDKFGKKSILLLSMAGVAPLTLILPYSPMQFIVPLFILIGFIITLSFSVAVVYAQEILPRSIGLVSGLIVGFSFGMGAVGTVAFGYIADEYSIKFIMLLCSFIPLVGLMSALLPSDQEAQRIGSEALKQSI